jgi:hypothetical protein
MNRESFETGTSLLRMLLDGGMGESQLDTAHHDAAIVLGRNSGWREWQSSFLP